MKENLLSLVENSRGYTLAVAEAMPVKLDNFKPAPDSWSFREQLHHIASGIEWWKDNFVKGIKGSWEPPALSKSRNEAVAYLNGAYDSLRDAVKHVVLSDEQIKGFFVTMDHATHHRGSNYHLPALQRDNTTQI